MENPTQKLFQSIIENARTGLDACEHLMSKTKDAALRDELIKLNEISKEVRLLQENHIDDLQQLFEYRKTVNERIFEIRAQIKKGQSKKGLDKVGIESMEDELKKLRLQIILCDRINRRNQQIQHKLQEVREEENRKRKEMIK